VRGEFLPLTNSNNVKNVTYQKKTADKMIIQNEKYHGRRKSVAQQSDDGVLSGLPSPADPGLLLVGSWTIGSGSTGGRKADLTKQHSRSSEI